MTTGTILVFLFIIWYGIFAFANVSSSNKNIMVVSIILTLLSFGAIKLIDYLLGLF